MFAYHLFKLTQSCVCLLLTDILWCLNFQERFCGFFCFECTTSIFDWIVWVPLQCDDVLPHCFKVWKVYCIYAQVNGFEFQSASHLLAILIFGDGEGSPFPFKNADGNSVKVNIKFWIIFLFYISISAALMGKAHTNHVLIQDSSSIRKAGIWRDQWQSWNEMFGYWYFSTFDWPYA